MSVTAMPKPTKSTGKDDAPEEEGGKRRSKKKLVIILVLVLVLGGAGFMMFRPKPPAPPKPGEVIALDPIQINLAADHYLRVGIALQLTDTAHEADGSKALDATIDQFSGREIGDVTDPKKRRELKKELEHTLGELYHHEVMEVYFTEFVTQ
jgi:flagellar FliL protein